MTEAQTNEALAQLHDKLAALDEKATKGPWEVDSEYDDGAVYSGGGGCGTGFKNFFIGAEIDGKWETLLDTQDSDHKLIDEDFDEDGKNAWDVIGHANTALIVELRNNLPTILAALKPSPVQSDEALVEELAGKLAPFVCRPVYNGDCDDIAAGQSHARYVARAILPITQREREASRQAMQAEIERLRAEKAELGQWKRDAADELVRLTVRAASAETALAVARAALEAKEDGRG